jgi:hypothetical protein
MARAHTLLFASRDRLICILLDVTSSRKPHVVGTARIRRDPHVIEHGRIRCVLEHAAFGTELEAADADGEEEQREGQCGRLHPNIEPATVERLRGNAEFIEAFHFPHKAGDEE